MTEPHPLQVFELAQCAIKVFFEAGLVAEQSIQPGPFGDIAAK
jgi:hypothetical protein